MTTATLNTRAFASKGDLETFAFTAEPVILKAIYVDADNRFFYAVDETNVIRKMSITRDVEHARNQYKLARTLVGKTVHFGVTAGWDGDVWFNEVIAAL